MRMRDCRFGGGVDDNELTALDPIPLGLTSVLAAISAPAATSAAADASSQSSSAPSAATALPRYNLPLLLHAKKGQIEYVSGEGFLLHVFWESPNMDAARELLASLQDCATATEHNTPAVPTYFFRLSAHDSQLCAPAARYVRDHSALQAAKKRLQMGIPRPAAEADARRRGLDPSWLDLDDDSELPLALRSQAGARIECTELYLDERAFFLHAGSKDYLDAYGRVLNPALQRERPVTLRLGWPTKQIQSTILEPGLKEVVRPVRNERDLWNAEAAKGGDASNAVFLSVDIEMAAAGADESVDPDVAAAVASSLPSSFRALCSTCVSFFHSLRPRTVRLMAVLPRGIDPEALAPVAALKPVRGEVCANNKRATNEEQSALRAALDAAGLQTVTITPPEDFSGYVLHARAGELRLRDSPHAQLTLDD